MREREKAGNMMIRAIIVLLLLVGAAQGIVQDNFILVVDQGRGIYQVDLETEAVHHIHTPDSLALYAIAYDEYTGRVYWSDWYTNTIYSVLLDGTDAQVLVNGCEVNGLAVDGINRWLYYTDHYDDIIYRVSLDGGTPQIVIDDSSLSVTIKGIVVDSGSQKIIWTSLDFSRIERANLDGSDREVLVQENVIYPVDVAVDENGMCWCEWLGEKVECADKDGSNRRLMNQGSDKLFGIQMTSSYIYVSAPHRGSSGSKTLMRLNRETLEMEDFGPPVFNIPWGIYLHETSEVLGPGMLSRLRLDWVIENLTPDFQQVVFLCNVSTAMLDPELDQLDVTFKIGATVLEKYTAMAYAQLPARLEALKKFPKLYNDETKHRKLAHDKMLRCEAEVKRDGNVTSSLAVEKFYGFKISSDSSITLTEQSIAEIAIHLNLPVLNAHTWVELHIPRFYTDFPACRGGHHIDLAMSHTGCRVMFEMSTEPQTKSIPLKAVTQKNYFRDRVMVVKLVSAKSTPNSVISDFHLEPVSVTFVDSKGQLANMRCYANCDPHMRLFSNRWWEMQYVGKFIMYKNDALHYEVQIQTELCERVARGATCVCGVVVRSGRSGYVIDTCGPRNRFSQFEHKYAPWVGMFDCSEGKPDMVIENSSGNTYTFTLPAGTKVTVYVSAWYEWHNVHIEPSPADYQNTKGVCGYISGPGQAEFRLRDGTINSNNRDFANDWRVREGEDLFRGEELPLTDPVYYCSCNETDFKNPQATGNVSEAHDQCIDEAFTNSESNKCLERKRRRRKRDAGVVEQVDSPVEDDLVALDYEEEEVSGEDPEWQNEWTEDKARAYCEDYIANKTSTQACQQQVANHNLLQDSINTCILDIKLTGDVSASSTHLETVTSSCLAEVKKNTTLWEEDEDQGFVPPKAVTSVTCPANCLDRGECVEGVCTCKNGFSGMDCSTNDSAVPEIFRLPQNNLCDEQEWTCNQIKVYAYDVFNTDTLSCRTTLFWVSEDSVEEKEIKVLPGVWDRLNTVVCRLPDASAINPQGVVGKAYRVQVSNDGENFSNAATMVVYSSKCANCSLDNQGQAHCTAKEEICKISGKCYDSWELNPDRYCQWCDLSASAHQWTLKADMCLVGNKCYTDGETNPSSVCDVCSPQQNTRGWTVKANLPPSLSSPTELKKTSDEELVVTLDATDPEGFDVTMTTEHGVARITDGNQLVYNGTEATDITIRLVDECGASSVSVIHVAIVECACAEYEVCIPSEGVARGQGDYTCGCPAGFEGSSCEVDIDECQGVLCVNGECVAGRGDYHCECDDGFEGDLCEHVVTDECEFALCEYGACVDAFKDFVCKCQSGYTGRLCDEEINECEESPCMHGTCIDHINTFTCACDSGFTGTLCEVNIDDCESNPCVHGNCSDDVNGFRCDCDDGYDGPLCDNSIDECARNPCVTPTRGSSAMANRNTDVVQLVLLTLLTFLLF